MKKAYYCPVVVRRMLVIICSIFLHINLSLSKAYPHIVSSGFHSVGFLPLVVSPIPYSSRPFCHHWLANLAIYLSIGCSYHLSAADTTFYHYMVFSPYFRRKKREIKVSTIRPKPRHHLSFV